MIGYTVGSYKLTEKIGEGGMGAVFKGIDVMLDREVAIKMLRPELARQNQIVERFRSEAVTLAKLNHPSIATLYSFLRQGDDFFMVMEYVHGDTLEQVISKQGALNCETAVTLFCRALEGIEHAHGMGVIHRDIKPANLMLTERGAIKVMDFGIARVLGTDRMTKAGHLIGTFEYMSPEQIRGQETDARSDIYSLGILLYEMLTGRVPFASPSEYELMRSQIEDPPPRPRDFAPQTPVEVEEAIMRALAKKKEDRFATAAEFRLALMTIQASHLSPGLSHSYPLEPANQSQHIKETRLASSLAAPAVVASQIKGTRLATDYQPSPNNVSQPDYNRSSMHDQPAPQPSLLDRLNWKHYAAGGAALFVFVAVLVGAPLGFILSRPRSVQGPDREESKPTPAATRATPIPTVAPIFSVPSAPPTSQPPQTDSRSDGSDDGSRTAKAAPKKKPAQPVKAENPPPPKPSPTPPPTSAKKEEKPKDEKKKRGFFGNLKKKIGDIKPY